MGTNFTFLLSINRNMMEENVDTYWDLLSSAIETHFATPMPSLTYTYNLDLDLSLSCLSPKILLPV